MKSHHHESGYALISISIFLSMIVSGFAMVQRNMLTFLDVERHFIDTDYIVLESIVGLSHLGEMLACNTPLQHPFKCQLPTTVDGTEIIYYVNYKKQGSTRWDIDFDEGNVGMQYSTWCEDFFDPGS